MTHRSTTARDTRRSRIDPFMLAAFRPMLSADGRRGLGRLLALNLASGGIEGLALLSILPLAAALTSVATGGSDTAPGSLGLSMGAWLWILAVAAVLGAAVKYMEAYQGYTVATDFIRHSQRQIGDHLAQLPLGWFTRTRSGRISQPVSSGIMSAGNLLAHIISPVLSAAMTILVVTLGTWLWSWPLGLTLTLCLPIVVLCMLGARRVLQHGKRPVRATDEEMASRIVEYAACQPALRAAGRSDGFAPLEEARAANDRALVHELWWSTLGILINGIASQAVVVAAITAGAALAVSGQMGAALTVAYIGMVLRFMRVIADIGEKYMGVEEARVPLESAEEILSTSPLPEASAPVELTEPGVVRVQDVGFSYGDGAPVVSGIDLQLRPGTATALVGPSGSGKTTLARLISRFWDVDAGTISVGGHDVRQMPLEQLMGQLSMVFQDVYLFDDTLEANIRVGRESAQDQEVREAADLAGVTALAARLPDGWQTRVGEGGRSLSGGERQRVSIARALLKDAQIVLFDEATSALDAENEQNVLASMERLREGSTLLVIAHKLDTVRSADTIVVLDEDGQVAERGTHEELFAAGGAYRRFWDRRSAATGWALAGR